MLSPRSRKQLQGNDCSPLNNSEGEPLGEYITSIINAFKDSDILFKKLRKNEEDDNIINYYKKEWMFGRYIGDLYFEHKNKSFRLIIKPRFGQVFIYHLLEIIYNIEFPVAPTDIDKSDTSWVNQLMKVIWIRQLAIANKYGLPTLRIGRKFIGENVRGKLNIEHSIKIYASREKLVSEYKEKVKDEVIIQTLKRALHILDMNASLIIPIPESVKEVISTLRSFPMNYELTNHHHISSIKLSPIYSSFRDIMNLSVKIIRNQQIGFKESSQERKKNYSTLVDVAELWEKYIFSLLHREFGKDGWKVYSKEFKIYESTAFSRVIIPDIILERDGKVIIFDAKYKSMTYKHYDYDRTDFFQIHTYTYYKSLNYDVIACGLIYPISLSKENLKQDDRLFGLEGQSIKFIIDGIDFSGLKDSIVNVDKGQCFIAQKEYIIQKEIEFLGRIRSCINI